MLDAGFLEAEDSDRHVSLAIGSVSVLEGPIPDNDAFVSGLGRASACRAAVSTGAAHTSTGSRGAGLGRC